MNRKKLWFLYVNLLELLKLRVLTLGFRFWISSASVCLHCCQTIWMVYSIHFTEKWLQNKRKQKHQHQSDYGNDFHCDGLQNCPVRDKVCNYCQKPNHFVSQCFTAKRNDQQTNRDGRKQKFVAALKQNSKLIELYYILVCKRTPVCILNLET